MLSSTLHLRTLLRAAEIAGGVNQLGSRLNIPPTLLDGFIKGHFELPQHIFLKCTEIVTEAGVADAAKSKSESIHAK